MPVAIVTGASSGIGAGLTVALRARGWHVVGLSRRSAPDADEYEECDVTDRETVAAVAARVLERHPRIDLLVNNAGHKGPPKFVGVDPEALQSVTDTNYLGGVWCLNAFLPGLAPGSHVVNIVSVAGTFAYGPYSSAKHAQLAFSRSIAVELAPRGVSVHTILPGFSETPGFPQEGRFPFPLNRLLVIEPILIVERTLRAIEFDQREVIVPRRYAPGAWVQALFPALVARVLGRAGLDL